MAVSSLIGSGGYSMEAPNIDYIVKKMQEQKSNDVNNYFYKFLSKLPSS